MFVGEFFLFLFLFVFFYNFSCQLHCVFQFLFLIDDDLCFACLKFLNSENLHIFCCCFCCCLFKIYSPFQYLIWSKFCFLFFLFFHIEFVILDMQHIHSVRHCSLNIRPQFNILKAFEEILNGWCLIGFSDFFIIYGMITLIPWKYQINQNIIVCFVGNKESKEKNNAHEC